MSVIVENTVQDSSGAPVYQATVRIRLVANPNTTLQPGWSATSSIVSTFATETDRTGQWSTALVPNATLAPANSWYEVWEQGAVSYIVVPASGGPYQLRELLVCPPPVSPPGITGVQVAADGTIAGVRPEINLVAGDNTTITAADNPADQRVDVTITASGGGDVSSVNGQTGVVVLDAADVGADPTGAAAAAQTAAEAYTDTQVATRVPTSRQVIAGTGLTGGGPLTGDVTLSLAGSTGLNFRGAWAANTTYAVNDVFTYAATTFVVTTGYTSGSVWVAGNLTNLTALDLPPWRFNVMLYGATGNGTTDDTATIQAAINAAFAYAQAQPGNCFAEVYFPVPAGGFYLCSGPLRTGSPTFGNAVLTIPIQATTAAKVTLAFTGAADMASTNYFASTTLDFKGIMLKFTATQGSLDSVNGEASAVGGPTPQQGYGKSTHLFNNINVVWRGVGLMVPHTKPGIGGLDLRGCASMNIINGGAFVDQWPSQMSMPSSAGYDFGIASPFPGNNDYCDVTQWTTYGYTYGAQLSEHVSLQSIRTLYTNIGIAAIGSFEGSSGALLFGCWQYASIETFNVALFLVGGARVNILALDCENPSGSTPLHIKDTAGTSLGYVGLCGNFTGTFTTPQVSATAKLEWKWLNQNPGAMASPPAVPGNGVPLQNQVGRDAFVVLTGGTVTAISIDGVTVASNAGGVTPTNVILPNQKSITLTSSVSPTWSWILL